MDSSNISKNSSAADGGDNGGHASRGQSGADGDSSGGSRRSAPITPRDYTVAKTTDFKSLAAKIAGEARKGTIQSLRAMGANNINTVVKGFALARRYIEDQLIDINCFVSFIEVQSMPSAAISGARTAIRFSFNRTTLRSQVQCRIVFLVSLVQSRCAVVVA